MDLEAKEAAALRGIGQEQALMREEQHSKQAENSLVNKASSRRIVDEPQENDDLWGEDEEEGGGFAAPATTPKCMGKN